MRTMITLCSLLLLSASAFAFEVQRVDDRVHLLGACAGLDPVLRDLAAWKKAYPDATCRTSRDLPEKFPGADCAYDVSDCLPEHARNYLGVSLANGGPNCWNTALVTSRLVPALRYSSGLEMIFYMESPLCRRLKANETPSPGDIGDLRTWAGDHDGQGIVHAFIYISKDLAFAKQGPQAPFTLRPLQDEIGKWAPGSGGVDCNTVLSDGKLARPRKDCYFVAYFHCQSMEEYLAKAPPLDETLRQNDANLSSVEKCVQSWEVSGGPLPTEAMDTIRSATQALIRYASDEKKVAPTGDAERDHQQAFLLASLQLRLQSLVDGIKYVQYSTTPGLAVDRGDYNDRSELQALTDELQKSVAELRGDGYRSLQRFGDDPSPWSGEGGTGP